MADITKFKSIFNGLDIAYGTYVIKGERGDGKQNGQATVVRKPPTDDLWERHLAGVEPSLGIIPFVLITLASGAVSILTSTLSTMERWLKK